MLQISTAPAVAPARMERIALGFFFSAGAAAMTSHLFLAGARVGVRQSGLELFAYSSRVRYRLGAVTY